MMETVQNTTDTDKKSVYYSKYAQNNIPKDLMEPREWHLDSNIVTPSPFLQYQMIS